MMNILVAWVPTIVTLTIAGVGGVFFWGKVVQIVTGVQSIVKDLQASVKELVTGDDCKTCRENCQKVVNMQFNQGAKDIGGIKAQLDNLSGAIHRIEINQAVAHAAGRRNSDADILVPPT